MVFFSISSKFQVNIYKRDREYIDSGYRECDHSVVNNSVKLERLELFGRIVVKPVREWVSVVPINSSIVRNSVLY